MMENCVAIVERTYIHQVKIPRQMEQAQQDPVVAKAGHIDRAF